eukprot:TRINITY_DN13201_c0_g1_i1.p1 TRINITY_DN13201_c0_g1~~TRINITY_DN13201_c0_g1_i1.p1  ORF type:complete len:261 (-),score=99.22 TRINITY_DN13201_c0_g1_i1:158-940(-)
MANNNCEGSCCPNGSWPSLQVDYEPQGKYEDLGEGLNVYYNGAADSTKAIMVIHDVFGVDSGRSKAIVDHFAKEGYFTVMPDLYRGNPLPSLDVIAEWAPQYKYSDLRTDIIERVIPFLNNTNSSFESISAVGFCWGSWFIFNMAGDDEIGEQIKVGVNFHPSLILEKFIFQKDPVELAKNVKGTKMILLSASNDPELVRPDGPVMNALKEKDFGNDCECHFFENQVHGWVNRGDVTLDEVKPDVQRALELGLGFLKKHA